MCVKFRIILDDEPNAFLTQSQNFRKVLHLYDDMIRHIQSHNLHKIVRPYTEAINLLQLLPAYLQT